MHLLLVWSMCIVRASLRRVPLGGFAVSVALQNAFLLHGSNIVGSLDVREINASTVSDCWVWLVSIVLLFLGRGRVIHSNHV